MIDENYLRKQHKQAMIIAGAMIQGCVLTGAVFFFIVKESANPSAGNDLLRVLAGIFQAAALAGSFYARRIILQKKPGEPDPAVSLSVRVARKLNTAMLIPYSLVEGAVLLGLVAAFMDRSPQDFILPAVVGVIGFAAHFPKYHEWETFARQHNI